jgi:predicted RNase H-related nuclease YkuK (DUF458 family)
MLKRAFLVIGTLLLSAALAQFRGHKDGNELKGHKVVKLRGVDFGSFVELSQLDIDIWSHDSDRHEVIAHVDPDQFEILQLMPEIQMSVLNDNVQIQVDRERSRVATIGRRLRAMAVSSSIQSGDLWFSNYHNYEEIKEWYQKLATRYHKSVQFVPRIGRTHQGRDIFAIHINLTPVRKGKKQIWIQGLIHAREWISGAVVQYLTHQLVQSSNESSTLPDVEYIIIPVVNPDGYVFTWNGNRLWRKNMAPGILGKGVDLNRNFDEHWGQGGASKIPISDTYQGPKAASEPETLAIQNYFKKQKNIVGVIDWHCYSQLILYPYGWTSSHIENYDDYQELTLLMSKAFKINGRLYKPRQSCDLYPTSGSATDWFVGEQTARTNNYLPFSLAIELPPPPTDGSGFMLDPKYIRPVGEESWAALNKFVQFSVEKAPPRR